MATAVYHHLYMWLVELYDSLGSATDFRVCEVEVKFSRAYVCLGAAEHMHSISRHTFVLLQRLHPHLVK